MPTLDTEIGNQEAPAPQAHPGEQLRTLQGYAACPYECAARFDLQAARSTDYHQLATTDSYNPAAAAARIGHTKLSPFW